MFEWLSVVWCAFSHNYEKTAESVTHTYHKCSRCGATQRWRKPKESEPIEPVMETTRSGHKYPRGGYHECDEPDCPAGALRK